MAFKLIVALAFVAVASAGYIRAPEVYNVHQPQVYHIAPVEHIVPVGHEVPSKTMEEYDAHPRYQFSYGVDDKVTGDSKSHFEERDGDVVHGEYSLIDADGYKRTVKYTADAHNGFRAVVHREPLNKFVHAAPVLVNTHLVAPAPQVDHFSPAAPNYGHYSAPDSYYHH